MSYGRTPYKQPTYAESMQMRITISIGEDQYRQWTLAASAQDISLSAYVRTLVEPDTDDSDVERWLTRLEELAGL